MNNDKVREALEEVWKPLVGYKLKYLISNFGNIKKITGEPVGRWLNDQGYWLVKLSEPRKDWRVHILVDMTFIPNPHCKPFVNYIDHNRANPYANNLEWCTQSENIQHAADHGRTYSHPKGVRSPNASLSNEDVINIRELYAYGNYSFNDLAKTFNISKRAIGRIINKETYTDV